MSALDAITDAPGILVGQAQDQEALTGCTVILCERGAIAGIDQRGGAPGTRETDALSPINLVQQVHAVLLAGGSAFGLDAAAGVMRYLREKGIGYKAGPARVPIVPAAILFDLGIGRPDVFPDAEMAYAACQSASQKTPLQGNYGAGTGATIGKILGPGRATKSGIGTASIRLRGGGRVGAILAINAFGDVVDPKSGNILAGVRTRQSGTRKIQAEEGDAWADTLSIMKSGTRTLRMKATVQTNTVVGVVATNARLTKPEATRVARMAQVGLARVIRPANTMLDGDTLFALSTGDKQVDVNVVGALAAEVVASAILNAVRFARSAGGIPAADIGPGNG
ncbi:MAG: P1 family peptidase [Chloroflexi bacterium]|nr:P1 family peptidase [Chloroflexota bacterium]